MSLSGEAAKMLSAALEEERRIDREQRSETFARLGTIEAAVRTETRIAEDRFKVQCGQFAELVKELADIKRKLGTNGSGGAHG